MFYSIDEEVNEPLPPRAANMNCCLRFIIAFQKIKPWLQRILQIIHFLIVMAYLWAGLVEFINNPPFFDAYGDAMAQNKLPEGIFQNDPKSQGGILRLMDVPILALLVAYVAVTSWLKFKGIAWLLTISISLALLSFGIVNFWAADRFEWRYYSSRMSGMELQVTTLALSGTVTLCVLFYKRKRLPFKFKSSLPIKALGPIHLIYNFCNIFLIMFSSMLMWFTKMYISWACFRTHTDLLQLCQLTTQVQCYACQKCSSEEIQRCYKNETMLKLFTCNTRFPPASNQGSFCIFNYNMSLVGFLTVFAYIGGLCVFLSTFVHLFGHYTLRALFLLYEYLLKVCNKSSLTIKKHREELRALKAVKAARRLSLENSLSSPRELLHPGTGDDLNLDIEDGRRVRSISELSISDISDSSYHADYGFLDASCG